MGMGFGVRIDCGRHASSSDVPSTPSGFSTRWLVALGLVLAVVVVVGLFVRVNTTPSVQTGVYLRVPEWLARGEPEAGDLVMACAPPGEAADTAREREYLRRTRTACAAGIVPVLKRVVAVAGQTVEVTERGVAVDGRAVGPAPRTFDSDGRPLQPAYGTHPLGDGELWLGSDITNGYDSRYLGAFARDLREGRARLLVAFD